jgi:hypothetical protein
MVRSVVLGQGTQYVKGHAVGETIIDYLSATDGGIQHLADCRSAGSLKKARKLKLNFADCQALISAVDRLTVWNTPVKAESNDPDTEAMFDGGKLVQLQVRFKGSELITLARLMPDLIARFGRPTETKMSALARDYPKLAEWNLPQIYVRAEEIGRSPSSGRATTIIVSVRTAEEYDRQTGKSVHHIDLLQ